MKKAREPKETRDAEIVGRPVMLLPVELTEDELLDRGRRLAECEERARTHEAHAESVKRELKSKEAEITSERSRLAGIVRSRKEPRDVECVATRDFVAGKFFIRRTDTGEVVESRSLALHELQPELPGLDANEGEETGL